MIVQNSRRFFDKSMTPFHSAAQFTELLNQQFELLENLIAYGEQQRTAIQESRMSELIAILAQKQPLLDRLGTIRQVLHDHQSVVEASSFWINEDARRDAQELRARAATAFETLIELERQCEVALSESRDQIRHRMESLDSGRAAANAYQSQVTPPASRIDFSSMG
jgi:flagellar biosynthesis/type III secretory pathway chaperone